MYYYMRITTFISFYREHFFTQSNVADPGDYQYAFEIYNKYMIGTYIACF